MTNSEFNDLYKELETELMQALNRTKSKVKLIKLYNELWDKSGEHYYAKQITKNQLDEIRNLLNLFIYQTPALK